jgi:hypothetical protein
METPRYSNHLRLLQSCCQNCSAASLVCNLVQHDGAEYDSGKVTGGHADVMVVSDSDGFGIPFGVSRWNCRVEVGRKDRQTIGGDAICQTVGFKAIQLFIQSQGLLDKFFRFVVHCKA